MNEQVADIFFVTPEALATEAWKTCIHRLISSRSLRRIFIDEAHQVISDAGFRIDFSNLVLLKFLNVALTFLTGTLSLSMEEELTIKFQRAGKNFKIIRSSSNRKNLCFKVARKGGVSDLDDLIDNLFGNFLEANVNARAIIYGHSIASIKTIVELSRFQQMMTSYSSDNVDSSNAQSTQSWFTGEKKIMVATSGFGVGIDYSSVRLVVCFGMPYSIEDMVQQFGRAGRDGLRSETILLPLTNFDNNYSSEHVLAYAMSDSICRRYFLSEYLDYCPVDCRASIDMIKCDVCSRQLMIRPQATTATVSNPSPVVEGRDTNIGRAQQPVFTAVGESVIITEANFRHNLMRALGQVRGKCLFCLFEHGILNETCNCLSNTNGRCFLCLKTGHGSNSSSKLKCPEFKVQANLGIHFNCGIKFSFCGVNSNCSYAKIIPTFWRRRNFGKRLAQAEVDEVSLKETYVEFIQFVDEVFSKQGLL